MAANAGTVLLDAQGLGRAIKITSGAVALSGLNITNGGAVSDGAGTQVYGANLTVDHCNIYNNTAVAERRTVERSGRRSGGDNPGQFPSRGGVDHRPVVRGRGTETASTGSSLA